MPLTQMLARCLAPLAFTALYAAAPISALQAQSSKELAAIVEPDAQSGVYMGAVLVADADGVLLDQAWGSANLEWDIANTSETKFRIASVTKQFTAVSILLLQERGLLNVDDLVSKHIADTPEAWAGITLRDLLWQTSGIPNVTSVSAFGTQKYLPTSQDELIALFADLPLEFEPSSKWSYSNSNYVLLSRVIENVARQSYSEFVTVNLFEPLEMQATGIDQSDLILQNRASGYSPSENGVVNAGYMNMAIPTGAGALYSTTGDLLKWQLGLFGGAVLSDESMKQLTTPNEFEVVDGSKYAMGLIVTDGPDGRMIWHDGGIEGFNAFLAYDPDTQTTVVVLANLNGGFATKLGMDLIKAGSAK